MTKKNRHVEHQLSDSAAPGLGERHDPLAGRAAGEDLSVGVGAPARRTSTFKTIRVETLPHSDQRYPTVGDWYETEDEWVIRVSDTGDWRYSLLVAIHEIVEMALCKHRGISETSVMDFDMAFEAARGAGSDQEPGDDPRAPYREEHRFATHVEKLLSAQLGVSWKDYEKALDSL